MKSRRGFLKSSGLVLTALGGWRAMEASAAQVCSITASQPRGPFYPIINQADKDTDLTTLAGSAVRAQGEVVWVMGTVRDQNCVIVDGALVEIWQACASGRYNHSNDPNTAPLDPHFQYWGRAITDAQGRYAFKTIRPGAYPADRDWVRPPHIHFRVMKRGYHELVTQMYFAGEGLNADDRILQSLSPQDQQESIVKFQVPAAGREPVGVFDLKISKVASRV
jgi:protocatechuate 3,4-dioxygenase beta subunit